MANREAIRLYRDILRGCKRFHWCDKDGEPWNRVLKDSARKEFDQAREEYDPLIVARLLVVGRQCLNDTLYKFDKTNQEIKDKIERTRNPGDRPSGRDGHRRPER